MPETRLLTGWGRTSPSASRVVDARAEEVSALVTEAGPRGILARGLGRSYGDAAQNAGGVVIRLNPGELSIDPAAGTVTVGGGVSLDAVMRELIPADFFVPVSPGTRMVTVGGAVAADIHGKNHHREGSLGSHVEWLELVDGTGAVRRLSADATPLEFWATVGGMGLTGVVTRACLRVRRIETALMRVDTERAGSLDDALALMADGDDAYTYSVAWIDLTSTGASMGRSVLTRGEHAVLDDVPPSLRRRVRAFDPGTRLAAPPMPSGLAVNPLTMRVFNELWFHKSPRSRAGQLVGIAGFFHPLDGVRAWNRLYGGRGFLQYQFAVPFGAEDALRAIVRRVTGSGHASSLAVLKRFGPANDAPLSFPIPGWTLALDLPVTDGLAALLDHLDQLVVTAGGRVYLAKDSRLRPDTLEAMYPRLAEFRAARDKLDPEGRFASDLSRRLRL